MFAATNIVKNSDKDKWLFICYGISFNGGDWWNFGNDTARNVILFGVDNSSSFYVDNRKNIFLILGLGPTFEINGSFGSPEKKFSINFTKANTKFCLNLNYNTDNSYLFVNGKEIIKLKPTIKMLTFRLDFV